MATFGIDNDLRGSVSGYAAQSRDRLIVSRRQYDYDGVYHDDFLFTSEGEIVGHLGTKER